MTIQLQYHPKINQLIFGDDCQDFTPQDFLKLAVAALDQWDNGSEEARELVVALEAFVEECPNCNGTGRISLTDKDHHNGRTRYEEIEDDCPACNGGIW